MPVEESKEKSSNVRTAYVSVTHKDNFSIPHFGFVKLLGISYPSSYCSNDGLYFLVHQYLINTGLFYIQNFTFQWKNRLESSVPALFCRSTCRVTLNKIYFTLCGIRYGAVGKFTR